jgi:hypothetical protein
VRSITLLLGGSLAKGLASRSLNNPSLGRHMRRCLLFLALVLPAGVLSICLRNQHCLGYHWPMLHDRSSMYLPGRLRKERPGRKPGPGDRSSSNMRRSYPASRMDERCSRGSGSWSSLGRLAGHRRAQGLHPARCQRPNLASNSQSRASLQRETTWRVLACHPRSRSRNDLSERGRPERSPPSRKGRRRGRPGRKRGGGRWR